MLDNVWFDGVVTVGVQLFAPCCLAKRPISQGETARFALRYGPFRAMIWHLLEGENGLWKGRFVMFCRKSHGFWTINTAWRDFPQAIFCSISQFLFVKVLERAVLLKHCLFLEAVLI